MNDNCVKAQKILILVSKMVCLSNSSGIRIGMVGRFSGAAASAPLDHRQSFINNFVFSNSKCGLKMLQL